MADKKCEKCGNARTNTYKESLPRIVALCDTCWRNFSWARTDRSSLWEQDNSGFVTGFIAGHIPAYPDNAVYQRALGIRALFRLRAIRVRQRTSMERSFVARDGDIHLASDLLNEPYEKVKKLVLVADISPGISAMEARMEKILEEMPIYRRYLKYIVGPGVVSLAGLVGETESARNILCWRHSGKMGPKSKLFLHCEHGKGEDLADALRVSRPNERVYGIRAFPSSSNLCGFFGLGFREGGMFTSDGQKKMWYISDRPSAGEQLRTSLLRKTLIVQYLAGSFEKVPKTKRGEDTPWVQHYTDEKDLKAAQWRKEFRYTPPPVCSACIASKCKHCEGSGKWEKVREQEQGIWVCRCHQSGYWFGSPAHLRAHALRETASLFLKLYWHVARHLEGLDETPRHPLATLHLH